MEEVIGFLEDKRPEVRAEAATTVASLTGSVDGMKLLQATGARLYPILLRLLHDTSSTVTAQVYATLVNLSLDETACRELLAPSGKRSCGVDWQNEGLLEIQS